MDDGQQLHSERTGFPPALTQPKELNQATAKK